jgi:uncharacterized membrane protein
MFIRLRNFWFTLRSSLWFVPTLMLVGAVGLSFLTIFFDRAVQHSWLKEFESVYSGGPDGARAVLAAIAGSMIGVTGVVFSITIVTLTLASAQFGPRLLRNFMRDLGNQIVLGTFIATFVYCLLVLRVVRDIDDMQFVPHISVTCGLALALASLGVLIYFIHHVSVSIQADHIIAAVSDDLHDTLERLFPEKVGQEVPETEIPDNVDALLADAAFSGQPVLATQSGYLRAVDGDGLMQIATANDCLFRLEHRPGDFVTQSCPLITVWPRDRVDERLSESLNNVCILGRQRTYAQDIGFAFYQLTEIAVRALSPGVNDPFTAVACIDYVGAALCQLAGRRLPSVYRYDEAKRLRVIAPPQTFVDIVHVVLDPIRQYSRTSITVVLQLLDMITIVAPHICREEDREALLHQAKLIKQGSDEGLVVAWDRQQVTARYETVVQALQK